MADLCKKHKFGYEPLRLLVGESCPLCLRENLEEVEQENAKLKEILGNVDSLVLEQAEATALQAMNEVERIKQKLKQEQEIERNTK